MVEQARVMEYKCPCCNASLSFDGTTQKLACAYCGNSYDMDVISACKESSQTESGDAFSWDAAQQNTWDEAENGALLAFMCPSCGGEILCEPTTAATFCPYCDNSAIIPTRLSGILKPDAVIPFRKSKEDAKAAFLELCKGKPLLPKEFRAEHRLERISGIYVPFWLYDCTGSFSGSYKATRIHHWTGSQFNYTKTDHFLLQRGGEGDFVGIPMDASAKMRDEFMESIEPYDYSELVPFDAAYLPGYLADRYDVPWENGKERIRQRVTAAVEGQIQSTLIGYSTALPVSRQMHIHNSKSRYALLPVWLLNTRYRDKLYTFVMNGQTGKMTGSFPVCPKRTAAWFAGVSAGVTLLAMVIQLFLCWEGCV